MGTSARASRGKDSGMPIRSWRPRRSIHHPCHSRVVGTPQFGSRTHEHAAASGARSPADAVRAMRRLMRGCGVLPVFDTGCDGPTAPDAVRAIAVADLDHADPASPMSGVDPSSLTVARTRARRRDRSQVQRSAAINGHEPESFRIAAQPITGTPSQRSTNP